MDATLLISLSKRVSILLRVCWLIMSMAASLKATGGPKRHLVSGFAVTLISRCFIGTVNTWLGSHTTAFRASAGSWNTDPETHEKKGFIHRCCESLQIGVPLVLSRGPHLDFEASQ